MINRHCHIVIYYIKGWAHIHFDTLKQARQYAKEMLKRDAPLTHKLKGAGYKIIRYNLDTGYIREFPIF